MAARFSTTQTAGVPSGFAARCGGPIIIAEIQAENKAESPGPLILA
jgi:hypothetical protein